MTVATTVPGYNLAPGTDAKTILHDETVNGIRIVRIATLPHHRVPYIFRGINQLFLPRFFTRAVLKLLPGPFDVVIVHSPPLPLLWLRQSLPDIMARDSFRTSTISSRRTALIWLFGGRNH